jgi:glutamate--cysteine ligase
MDFLQLIQNNNLSGHLLYGLFGLEKENLRTDINGNLALTPHPTIFGDKAENPYITTDFAESQIEIVTPALASPIEAHKFLQSLHDVVSLTLKDEYLWPYSLPPILPDDDSLIKAAHFTQPEITEYREYLSRKYGKRKQLLSGIHYNFSFSNEFMHSLFEATDKKLSYREFNDEVYLKVARLYLKYSWLVIYFFGANSVAHESYMTCATRSRERITHDTYDFHGSSSFRNGISGYRNLKHFYVSYNSLPNYIRDIKNAIGDGTIIAAKEYYSQIRLKGHSKGSILEDLEQNGINYIEIRTLDLNPLSPLGVTMEQLDFIHLMLVYCLLAPDFCMTDDDYRFANINQLQAADANRDEVLMLHSALHQQRSIREWGNEFIQNMYDTLKSLNITDERLSVLKHFQQQLVNNDESIASQVKNGVIRDGYAEFFMHKVDEYLTISKMNLSDFKLANHHENSYINQILSTLAIG